MSRRLWNEQERHQSIQRQGQLPGLAEGAGSWSVSALLLLMGFKGLAWSISLAGFRGGPTCPGLFLGAALGVLASHLPGLTLTPAVAVGIGAAAVAVLRLPLSAVFITLLLTSGAGAGVGPIIIVAAVVAYLATETLAVARDRRLAGHEAAGERAAPGAPAG